MNNVIKELFIEYGYEIDEFNRGYVALQNGKEYFIVSEYQETELQQFFECERTDAIIEEYTIQHSKHSDFKKNCSLIICCNVQDICKFKEKNISTIFRIEEDEYYFRKYVLIYTNEALKGIESSDRIGERINEIVQNTDLLDKYQKSINDNQEYFVAVQLMVKLPFLNFHLQNNDFVTVEQEITRKITSGGKGQHYQQYISFTQFIEGAEDSEYFEKLQKSMLSSEENDEMLNDFIKVFRGDSK